MPILNVNIIGDINKDAGTLSKELANKAGEILNSGVGHTWVKLNYIPESYYAENHTDKETAKPVFIELIRRNDSPIEMKEKIAKEFANEFSTILGRPEYNIHTYFLPEGLNRIAFGGNLVK